MRILLTGANGFIGKNYLDRSINKSIHVMSRKPIHHPAIYDNYIGDLNDSTFIKKVINNDFDAIIHCAWEGLPDRSASNNLKNLKLYRNLIDNIDTKSNIKNIFIGSCLEYGELTGTIKENDTGINISDFGATKLKIYKHVIENGLNFTWLRPFYLYGRNQHKDALMQYLYRRFKNGQEIELQNPNRAHDYIYVADLVDMIKRIEQTNTTNEIFNVGNGSSVSVAEITNLISSLYGNGELFSAKISPVAIADMNKAMEVLKWKPKYTLKMGVVETLEYAHD